jgi:hypothetical protein
VRPGGPPSTATFQRSPSTSTARRSPHRVTIEWPDGRIEHLNLPAEGYRHFVYTQDPEEDHWTAPPRYLTIRATPLWTPAEFDPASTDNRQLGVYVSAFRMTAPLRVAAGLPELRY